jgi:hypothetical protein
MEVEATFLKKRASIIMKTDISRNLQMGLFVLNVD